MAKQNKKRLNHVLGRVGLATLDDPRGFLDQFAFLVQSHDHYRSMLLACEPEKRQEMYNSLRGRLSFEPKPLEVYLSEGAQQAEQEQLPTYDHETGRLTEYRPPSVGEIAEQSIQRDFEMQNAKGAMTLTCAKCTFTDSFVGDTKVDATIKARKAGWVYDPIDEKPRELCPDCAPSNALRVRSRGNA